MAKNPRYYHTAVHKNITRDRFIRSVNPIVAEKMRAILEELKRKESGRGCPVVVSWHPSTLHKQHPVLSEVIWLNVCKIKKALPECHG